MGIKNGDVILLRGYSATFLKTNDRKWPQKLKRVNETNVDIFHISLIVVKTLTVFSPRNHTAGFVLTESDINGTDVSEVSIWVWT